ncbi:hypothetical protein GALL_535510 [mine drainage metagenome]|uniref:Uncharacterized protein n=1 Tax=mine drainage metagenome TaxID=410659 RepID=A0A1J5P026_9ZZZZ
MKRGLDMATSLRSSIGSSRSGLESRAILRPGSGQHAGDAGAQKVGQGARQHGPDAQAGQVAPEVEPNEADRLSAEALGQRVAVSTRRWIQGA